MISQHLFAEVIDTQTEIWAKKVASVPREILNDLPHEMGFASIITGVRRCGKSTLQKQILQKYKLQHCVFLNLEDIRLAGMQQADYERLYKELKLRKPKAVFLDKVQMVAGWEILVNQLLREKHWVCITGSNASLLSSELATHLTGRHFSTELFPFSYTEFLQFRKLKPNKSSLQKYLDQGGMPDYLRTQYKPLLNALMDDILVRDVAVRHKLRDVESLRQLAVYLLSHIGCLISANKLKGMFGIKSSTTILEYFSYLQDAYLLEFVPLYDYSIKKQIRNPQKVYAIDMGMYHQNNITFSPNHGHVLENLVYLHLRRLGYKVYYYQGNGECDFLVTKNSAIVGLYQVCYELNSSNLDRELNGLSRAMDEFGIQQGKIITYDQKDHYTIDMKTIEVSRVWEWMQ